MARTTSVTLGEPLNEFINEMVASGRYGSTSEVVRTALRMLEEKEQYLAQLRQAIGDGDASGYATESLDEMMKRAKNELYQEIMQGIKSSVCDDTFDEIVAIARNRSSL